MSLFGPSYFESMRAQKLAQRQSAIDKATAALALIPVDPSEPEILKSPAWQLAAKIASKDWSAVTVVAAFARRSIEAHNDLNTLTEGSPPQARRENRVDRTVMLVEALETAKELDAYQARTGTTMGPLHGVPFTLKDTFAVKDYDSSIGISSLANKPSAMSSPLHTTLTKLGGILLAKTNVPQTLLAFECNNPIFGVTGNPVVKGFTSGGSSGGEAAVLARDASALGFGSDIGGSLRIPAGWCGIYSLKTVRGRFPVRGHSSLAPGRDSIPCVTGPMGRNVDDLIFIMKLVLGEGLCKLDSSMYSSTWNESTFQTYSAKKLKVGYYFDDGVTIASPPVYRAIMQTVQALKSQGHEVVLISPPNVVEAVRIFIALTSDESYADLRLPLKRDPMEPTVRFLLTLARLPRFLRAILTFLIHRLLRDPVSASTIALLGNKSASQVHSWHIRRDTFRQAFNDWFQSSQLDCIIAPTSTIPAATINGTVLTSALATSTLLYNVVDYPVGVVPVTRVGEKGEGMEEGRWKGREKEGYSWMFLDQVYGRGGLYKRIEEGGAGLPVGVQVVGGLSAGEEGVLAMMGQVVKALKAGD